MEGAVALSIQDKSMRQPDAGTPEKLQAEDSRRSNATRPDIHFSRVPFEAARGAWRRSGVELFLHQFLALEHGIPSHDATPSTLMESRCRSTSFEGRTERLGDGMIAIDGKALPQSLYDVVVRCRLHLVQAFASEGTAFQARPRCGTSRTRSQ